MGVGEMSVWALWTVSVVWILSRGIASVPVSWGTGAATTGAFAPAVATVWLRVEGLRLKTSDTTKSFVLGRGPRVRDVLLPNIISISVEYGLVEEKCLLRVVVEGTRGAEN
ncbi:hypothetical protein B0H14DRAFT_3771763 [Mycena olivaceomarginata]|nr:hypothetical protein B0H14DRAFT_3771763 [Mycena olivaceomarginata]